MRCVAVSLIVVSVLAAPGCEPTGPSRPAPPPPRAAPAASPWRVADDSVQIAVDDPGLTEELEIAMAQARATLADAQRRWMDALPAQRRDWSVKWAAPTADGTVEYLWVEPKHWSPFRVEGRLASPPQRPLPRGQALDDLVGFPAEELVDWMYAPAGAPPDGGFTVAVLRKAFGDPGETPATPANDP